MTPGPWTRGDVLDLHIFVLLVLWFTLDRSNVYFSDILNFLRRLTRAFDQICTLDYWRGKQE